MRSPPRWRHAAQSPQFKPAHNKPNTQKKTLLQLWVEHGSAISTRSAILLSRTLSAHSSARAALTASTLSHFLTPLSSTPEELPSAAPTPQALAQREALRKRRREKTDAIVRRENEKREEAKRLAEERRVAEKTAELKRLQEQREQERKAAEVAVAASRQQEKSDQTERKAVKLSSRGPLSSSANAVLPGTAAQPATPVETIKAAEIRKPVEVPKCDERPKPPKQRTTASGLQLAMIAGGISEAVRGSDKIEAIDGTAEDLVRVVEVWNRTCDEAEPFRRDSSMRKPRMDIKKQVNLTSNQIAASVKHVSQKVSTLGHVLVNASNVAGPPGEAFAMKEIAMRLVRESDGSVSLNRTAAFAVGAVIVGVAASARDCGKMRDVFLGAFYKHSMYTMPAYGRRRKSESVEDFRSRIGYKDGETPDSYMERSCGCLSLFAAVVQTDHVIGQAQAWQKAPNPFSLDLAWTWLARIANREQHSITPALAFAFLEIAGYSMSVRYRKQFAKLMAMVQQAVVINAVKSAPKGAISRMDSLVEEFIAGGCVISKPPEGRALPAKDLEFL